MKRTIRTKIFVSIAFASFLEGSFATWASSPRLEPTRADACLREPRSHTSSTVLAANAIWGSGLSGPSVPFPEQSLIANFCASFGLNLGPNPGIGRASAGLANVAATLSGTVTPLISPAAGAGSGTIWFGSSSLSSGTGRGGPRPVVPAPSMVRMFVSYAREDRRQLKWLGDFLDALARYNGVVHWLDASIGAGQQWNPEISNHLDEIHIFLFVASRASLASPYIQDVELPRARERHAVGDVEMGLLKLEPSACDDDPFLGTIQRLAPEFSSIAQARLEALATEAVRRDVAALAERVRDRKSVIG